jgi:hypothetical protein
LQGVHDDGGHLLRHDECVLLQLLLLNRLADARPLALFRIAFYAVIAVDACKQLFDLTLLTDDGILPLELLRLPPIAPASPLALLVATKGAAVLLLAVGATAALLTALGLFTRVASVVVFVYLVTLHSRNPYILDGGDQTTAVMAFFAMFAELDGALSLRRGQWAPMVPALPVLLLQLELSIIHLAAGLAKNGTLWNSGDALYCILQNNDYVRPLGMSLLVVPRLCKALTYAARATEIAFLPLAFSPWRRTLTRRLAVGSALALHLGILAFMRVGIFPYVMMSSLCLFLPAELFDRARVRVRDGAPPKALPRWLMALVVLVLVDMAMASLLPASLRRPFEAPLERVGIGQHWSMFAPGDRFNDGYFVGRGRLTDGRELDPLAALAPRMLPVTEHEFSRWFKLRDNVASDMRLQLMLLRHLCAAGRALTPPLAEATLQHFARRTHLPSEAPLPFTRDVEIRWQCRR